MSLDRADAASVQRLLQTFDTILATLCEKTGASRTTLRLDDARHGLHVNDVAGEALAPDESKSLRGQTAIDQRAAATAQWIDAHRRLLVQNDLSIDEPRAPGALIQAYGVKAQMLAPVVREGRLDGWVSVHEARRVRQWTEAEQQAALAAADEVLAALAAVER
jgi:maleate isomerase